MSPLTQLTRASPIKRIFFQRPLCVLLLLGSALWLVCVYLLYRATSTKLRLAWRASRTHTQFAGMLARTIMAAAVQPTKPIAARMHK